MLSPQNEIYPDRLNFSLKETSLAPNHPNNVHYSQKLTKKLASIKYHPQKLASVLNQN